MVSLHVPERDAYRRGASVPGMLAAVLLTPLVAHGGEFPVSVRQGTDFAVAATPAGDLVMDLGGRLWRLPPGGGRAAALTPAGEFARHPAFSPDGKRLAWQSLRDGFFEVMVADTDGGNAQQITSGSSNYLSPAWSPDGRRIAFSSDRGGDFSLWECDLETRELRQLTFEPGQELDPAWAPDGRSLAYISERPGVSSLVVRAPFQSPRVLVTARPAAPGPGVAPRRQRDHLYGGRPAGPAAQHGDPVRSARGQAGRAR